MADDEDDKDEGSKEIARLEKKLKTNRTLFFSLLVSAAVIISILITSVLVINLQLANRNEIPAEDFAELLQELDTHLKHLSTIHNAEAQAYFAFQDSLMEIKDLYQHDKINTLRQALVEREQDTRQLLSVMQNGITSLANMSPGSRQWTTTYATQVKKAQEVSAKREKMLRQSMKTDEELQAEAEAAEKAKADEKAKKKKS